MKSNTNEDYIDLLQLGKLLISKSWIITLAAIICTGITFFYTYNFITPQYEADVKIYVNNTSLSLGSTTFSISSSDLSAAQSLVDTYLVILNSRSTLDEIINQANVNYTSEQLKEMITAEAVNNTEIFKVTVKSPSPKDAAKIANTAAMVLPGKIADTVDGSSVRVVDYAEVPTTRVSPNYTKNTALGFVMGVVLSAMVIIIVDLSNSSVRSEDYLTETYPNIPLLSVIPDVSSDKAHGYYKRHGYYSSYANSNGGNS